MPTFAEIGAIRVGIAVVLLAAMVSCAIASFSVWWKMVDEVNARLPQDQRLGFSRRYDAKVKSEYERLFPSGELLRRARRFEAALAVVMPVIVWTLHFPASAIVFVMLLACVSIWLSFR